MWGVLSGASLVCPSGALCRVSSGVTFRVPMSSNFMKFTWHAYLHYRYL